MRSGVQSGPNADKSLGEYNLVFGTLRYRNFRPFFGGGFISFIRKLMQQVALTWLVYRLTNFAFLLGSSVLPDNCRRSSTGPKDRGPADRIDRHRIIIVTQTGILWSSACSSVSSNRSHADAAIAHLYNRQQRNVAAIMPRLPLNVTAQLGRFSHCISDGSCTKSQWRIHFLQ